ncbi:MULTISPECIES: hypothetical protein [Micromonospora]|uniref:hypothetical protein n=1 Tax=Micromonospora TaxID=1873 RepID=UPI001EE953AB|nr:MULTISPECIES: hypothetical protein [Micromonospora]MCG5449111.1 hypothetical protein [Micromonospora hortensis]MCX5119016.1 hypothetical protein [Micromonospora sp. NBC_00362]WTI08859.1 hypothetical protein OHB44_03985 [Micromonospora sp. NBC_00821]
MRTSDLRADVKPPTRASRPAHRAVTSDTVRPVRRATHRTHNASPPDTVAPVPAAGWRGGHRRAAGRATIVASVLTVSLGWLIAILVAPHVTLSPGARMVALFCHLTCLVVGFGAVLTVDWFSLRWLLRQEPLGTVLTAARGAHLLIWLGLVGLLASGTALGPDTSSALVWVKLLAVLVVGINGLFLGRVRDRLVAVRGRPPWSALLPGVAAATISQLAWWTATLVGFWNANG